MNSSPCHKPKPTQLAGSRRVCSQPEVQLGLHQQLAKHQQQQLGWHAASCQLLLLRQHEANQQELERQMNKVRAEKEAVHADLEATIQGLGAAQDARGVLRRAGV